MIYLYMMIGKKSKRNFPMTSLATCLSLADQIGVTLERLLTKFNRLRISGIKSSRDYTADGYAFGVKFKYGDLESVDDCHLKRAVAGLKFTFAFLQAQLSMSPTTMGKVGMRQSGPREKKQFQVECEANDRPVDGFKIDVDKNGKPIAKYRGLPLIEFHKVSLQMDSFLIYYALKICPYLFLIIHSSTQESSLHSRIHTDISHRYLAVEFVTILFDFVLTRNKIFPSTHEYISFSLRMFEKAGPDRFDFLRPLAGFALWYSDCTQIDADSQALVHLWRNATNFYEIGIKRWDSEVTEGQKIGEIIVSFRLSSHLVGKSKTKSVTLNRKTPRENAWCYIRTWVFSLYLQREKCSSIKDYISQKLNKEHYKMLSARRQKNQEKMNRVTPAKLPRKNKQAVPKTVVQSQLATSAANELNKIFDRRIERCDINSGKTKSGYTKLLESMEASTPVSQTADNLTTQGARLDNLKDRQTRQDNSTAKDHSTTKDNSTAQRTRLNNLTTQQTVTPPTTEDDSTTKQATLDNSTTKDDLMPPLQNESEQRSLLLKRLPWQNLSLASTEHMDKVARSYLLI